MTQSMNGKQDNLKVLLRLKMLKNLIYENKIIPAYEHLEKLIEDVEKESQ